MWSFQCVIYRLIRWRGPSWNRWTPAMPQTTTASSRSQWVSSSSPKIHLLVSDWSSVLSTDATYKIDQRLARNRSVLVYVVQGSFYKSESTAIFVHHPLLYALAQLSRSPFQTIRKCMRSETRLIPSLPSRRSHAALARGPPP